MIARKEYKLTGQTVRPYELSVWTLNDDFITVLKPMDNDYFGTVQDGEISIADDGTQELTFSIPMYIKQHNNLIENPIWDKAYNNQILVNMRKIKLIFNKGSNDIGIFEFVIDEITESHKNDVLTCEVKSSGLAFHELGKLGYKVVLSADEFYNTYEQWFSAKPQSNANLNEYNTQVAIWEAREPNATIDYWNVLMGIDPYPTNSIPFKNKWYYKVQMDWTNYDNTSQRYSTRIYEEPYTSDWNDGSFTPKTVQKAKEKARLVDKKESNLYNLTQEVAKTFGVFCRYEYEYDDNYHIIARTVVYYNNFLNETSGIINFSYPYASAEVSRTIESNDLITKMYVPDTNASSDTQLISITQADVNRTKEDYILNFDYLYKIGTITPEQYDLIAPYETNMASLNSQLHEYYERLTAAYDKRVELNSAITYYTSAVSQDIERINAINDIITSLDMIDGMADGIITNESPKTGILIKDENSGKYSLTISEKGVIFNTLEIYTDYNFLNHTLSGQIATGSPVYDEYMNLLQVTGIQANNLQNTMVYLIYSYSPEAYYAHIKTVWTNRLNSDTNNLDTATNKLHDLNLNIEYWEGLYYDALAQKKEKVEAFNRAMGTALREGYWVPDTYTAYDTKCKETLALPEMSTGQVSGVNKYTKRLFWDMEKITDDEESLSYAISIDQTQKYYLCIDLTNVLAQYKNDLDNLSVFFYDYTATVQKPYLPEYARSFTANSTCKYAIASIRTGSGSNNVIKPLLVLTGASSLTDDEIAYLKENGRLGIITSRNGEIVAENTASITWISEDTTRRSFVIYPRFEIDSYYLKTDSTSLLLSYGDSILENYKDYYVLAKDNKQYISIKPQAMFQEGDLYEYFTLIYNVSNINSAIYLDAVEVAKTNSQPKVSYDIKLNCLNEDFIHTAYQMLSRIISISDVDLHFDSVFGYISSLKLNLDFPEEDTVEIKNYKNKFEDLFSTIVANTEAMQRSEFMSGVARGAFNNNGTLKEDTLQTSLDSGDLYFKFNNERLNLNEVEGLQGTSKDGLVAMRYDGIFTANTKNNNNDWVWQNVIGPDGVRAEAITRGKLNIKELVIQAGDDIKFQITKDGVFAFKSFMDDQQLITQIYASGSLYRSYLENENAYKDVDHLQYVVHNSQGIFLRARRGDLVYDESATDNYNIRQLTQDIDRVELSWQGFKIRDWSNNEVFWADTEGNVHLKGIIEAMSGGKIANWSIFTNILSCGSGSQYVALQSSTSSTYVFWAGNEDPAQADFAIEKNGHVVLKNASLTGNSIISTYTNSEYSGKITTSDGWIGGDSAGLTIFSGGLGDGRIGWIKTNSATDIGFWAGSNTYIGNNQRTLANDSNIKFKIFGNGTSYIKESNIVSPTISGGTISIGDFSVAGSGLCSIGNADITGGTITIGTVSPTSSSYFSVNSSGVLNASSVTLRYVTLYNVSALYLGVDANSCLDSNHRIKTAYLSDYETIDEIKNILNTTSTYASIVLSLDCVEQGTYLRRMAENVPLIVSGGDIKLSWAALSTISQSAANGGSNIFSATNFSISADKISIFNGSGLDINITSSAATNPNYLTVTMSNAVPSISIAGNIIGYTGKVGYFDFSSGELYYSSSNGLNQSTLGISTISYSNSNGVYFSMSAQKVTVPTLTIKENDALTIYYGQSNNRTEVHLSSAQLAALASAIQQDNTAPSGYSLDSYIQNIVANYING